MQRRTLLGALAGSSAFVLAGCLGGAGGSDEETTTDERTDTPTDTPTDSGDHPVTTTHGEPTITQTDFTVVGEGHDAETPRVSFESDTVMVTGTITGANACYTANLKDASYAPDSDTLTVSVEAVTTVGEDETRACAQVLVEIDYQATVEFSGGLPGEVEVLHDGTEVHVETVE